VRLAGVRVLMPHHPAQRWAYDAGSRRWVQLSGAPRVAVANLVIQTVRYKTVFLNRQAGVTAPSPARPLGDGRAVILSTAPGRAPVSSGQEVRVDWSKPDTADITNYVSSRGVLAEFTPGPTWVLLAPAGTRVVPVQRTAR